MQQTDPISLGELVTIVVAPREKHSTLPDSLDSLFATISPSVRVICCLAQLPENVRNAVEYRIAARTFTELHELEPDVTPHKARATGAQKVTTPWLVFADNDLQYEAGWLDALAAQMRSNAYDVLAPLIFIGPPSGKTIHHAGGLLHTEDTAEGKLKVREVHRLMNTDIETPGVIDQLHSVDYQRCEVAEFHCLAMRAELLHCGLLNLPESLITREQQDLALQCQKHQLKVGFVPESRVTYMAYSPFTPEDLHCHARRWSEARALASLDYMETTWKMDFNRKRVISRWIRNHRRRPFRSYPDVVGKLLPNRLEAAYLRWRFGYEL